MKDGYSQRFMYRITDKALKKYNILKQSEAVGVRKMYRNREELGRDRASSKLTDKAAWFYKRGYHAILRVEDSLGASWRARSRRGSGRTWTWPD